MGIVAQHALSTFSSPVNATSPIDANTVRGNDNTIKTAYNAHDADTTIHLQNGAISSRPSASTTGQMWLATDTGAVVGSYDTGSAWVSWNYVATDTNGSAVITSSQANAFDVGPNGTTNPTLQVDCSTASAATGLKLKSAAAGGGFALSVISSGTDENLTINAKNAGAIGIGSISTGRVTITPATTITGALTQTGLATFNGGATVASGQTLTVSGATVTGLTAASVGAGTFPAGAYVFASGGVTVTSGGFTVSAGTTAVQALTATTVTATNSSGVIATFERSDAAGNSGIIAIKRGGTIRYYIGVTSTDIFALYDAAGSSQNLTVTDAGALAVRAGITATAATFSGLGGGGGAVSVGASDSGGAGFRLLRVPN